MVRSSYVPRRFTCLRPRGTVIRSAADADGCAGLAWYSAERWAEGSGPMVPVAAYDDIADWYEQEFLARSAMPGADPLGIERALRGLLGSGGGVCLEIGCGTGARAARVRDLGWAPAGID